VESQKSSRVGNTEATSSVTHYGRGAGIRSDRRSISTRRDSASSIQRIGIAFRMIRPSQDDRLHQHGRCGKYQPPRQPGVKWITYA